MESRAQSRKSDEPLPLPEVECPGLATCFHQVGRVQPTTEGVLQLSSVELQAWAQGTRTRLTSWEFTTLLEMSRAYAVSNRLARSPAAPAPWAMEVAPESQADLKRRMKAALRGNG